MKFINRYSKFIPYLYFIVIIIYWFTGVNKNQGITAYPILLFSIPFLWQVVKPNRNLNLKLGVTFVCLSSYLILAHIFDILNIISFTKYIKSFILYSDIFVFVNFLMALWIIRNSLKKSF